MAKDVAPADESGASDPFIRIYCGKSKADSSIKHVTLNPGWFETITMDVQIPRGIPSGISASLYDHDDDDSIQLIGRTWIEFENEFTLYKVNLQKRRSQLEYIRQKLVEKNMEQSA